MMHSLQKWKIIQPNINWQDWNHTSFEVFIRYRKKKFLMSQCTGQGQTCCGHHPKKSIDLLDSPNEQRIFLQNKLSK